MAADINTHGLLVEKSLKGLFKLDDEQINYTTFKLMMINFYAHGLININDVPEKSAEYQVFEYLEHVYSSVNYIFEGLHRAVHALKKKDRVLEKLVPVLE